MHPTLLSLFVARADSRALRIAQRAGAVAFVTVLTAIAAQVSIPLQLNRKNLQDRKVAEAQERVGAAALRAEDARRDLETQYQTALADYRAADAQLESLRSGAIPSLEAAFKTAQARYAGGQGSLDLPLTIVRRYVETNISLVEQEGKKARAAAEIIYLTGEDAR